MRTAAQAIPIARFDLIYSKRSKGHPDMPTSDSAPWIYWRAQSRTIVCRRCGCQQAFPAVKRTGPAYAVILAAFMSLFEARHETCSRKEMK
jgi:hypothetical protein